MGYRSQRKSPRGAIHQYKKSLHEKTRQVRRRTGKTSPETPVMTEREITDLTLRRLHTLGSQRFGSSPFSLHFDRWLADVETVLAEFESYPSIGVDEQYIEERSAAIMTVKRQLEQNRQRETALEQEISKLADSKNHLKLIDIEYSAKLNTARGKRNSEVKHLNREIDELKKQQQKIIRMKTGFFRGISKKERERRELAIDEELNRKQNELEVVLLDYITKRKQLQSEYSSKREPEVKQIKSYQKKTQEAETDPSLEERWFACEALADTLNSFLQRKAANPSIS